MSMVKKNISLTLECSTIYKIISEKKEIVIDELEKISNINRGKLEFHLPQLIKEGLVERSETKHKRYSLTEEGKAALEQKLIELRIYEYLEKNQDTTFKSLTDGLATDSKALNAGIGLLKKNDIITITKGIITLTGNKPEQSEGLQQTLENVARNNKTIDVNLVNELGKRNLIESHEYNISTLKVLEPYETVKDYIHITQEIARLTPEMLRSGEWRDKKLKAYNLNVSPPNLFIGRKQPYARFIDDVKRKLSGLGFYEMRGPLVELELFNFDALFQAQDHPAREWSDVYRVSNPEKGKLPKKDFVDLIAKVHEEGYDTGSRGWRYKWSPEKAASLVLRAQGTSTSARTLENLPVPSKFFSISRCFRPDAVDATHLSEFNQVEGIAAIPGVTFRDLLGVLKVFAVDVAEADPKTVSFRPDYYPFTSPSVELSVEHPTLGRIEFGGAGIFRPEVTRPFGIDVPVIAWGLGIDRLFMVKYGIDDIRELFSHKLSWLRQAKLV